MLLIQIKSVCVSELISQYKLFSLKGLQNKGLANLFSLKVPSLVKMCHTFKYYSSCFVSRVEN